MIDAVSYPINFPYGATTAPYSSTHPHRGDDRACPMGTPIIINGVTIGLTGDSGQAIGPHLHIQEWQGDYAITRKPQNAFKAGTVVNIDPTGTQGDGSFGLFITVQTADGWNNSYCHLSEIHVIKGQIIGGDMPASQDAVDPTVVELEYNNGLLRDANPGEVKGWVDQGTSVETFMRSIQNSAEHIQVMEDYKLGVKARTEGWVKPGATPTPLKPGTYEVK